MRDLNELRGNSVSDATLSLKPYFFFILVRTEPKDLTPKHIMKAREYATSGGSMADNETVGDAKVPCI
jgi:hypothetical protein